MTARRGWSLPEHLALDALVAFVDGELSASAYDRAAAHLAHCSACSAEAAAQRQARTAVRGADTPHVPPELLRALESIPDETGLPDQPDELAVTEDGQLVTAQRHATSARSAAKAPKATATAREEAPDGDGSGSAAGRRARQGAGIMVSGLVLGALAFMNIPSTDDLKIPDPSPLPPPGGESSGTGGAANAVNSAVLPDSPASSAPPAPPALWQVGTSAQPAVPLPPSSPEPPAMLAGSQPPR